MRALSSFVFITRERRIIRDLFGFYLQLRLQFVAS